MHIVNIGRFRFTIIRYHDLAKQLKYRYITYFSVATLILLKL